MNVSRRSARGPPTETEAYGVTKANAPMRNEAVAKARSNGDATRERTAETMPTAHHPIAEAIATMPRASSVRAMGRRGQRSHGSQEEKMVSVRTGADLQRRQADARGYLGVAPPPRDRGGQVLGGRGSPRCG